MGGWEMGEEKKGTANREGDTGQMNGGGEAGRSNGGRRADINDNSQNEIWCFSLQCHRSRFKFQPM